MSDENVSFGCASRVTVVADRKLTVFHGLLQKEAATQQDEEGDADASLGVSYRNPVNEKMEYCRSMTTVSSKRPRPLVPDRLP